MAFRDDLLPIVSAIRAIPTTYGVRQHEVVIRTTTWATADRLGTPTVANLTITPRPKVREAANGRELLVGPITPNHSGGGYTVAQLNPDATNAPNVDSVYLVTGPNGTREYECIDITTDRGYQYMLRLVASERKAPL
jgi:hypothetical protein